MIKQILQISIVFSIALSFVGCGSEESSSVASTGGSTITSTGNPSTYSATKYDMQYKGLSFYNEELPIGNYKLSSLTDNDFDTLSDSQQLLVADKLLSSMFFAYPLHELQEKIDSGTFISSLQEQLNVETTDKAWLESYIINEDIFGTGENHDQEVVDILKRFYFAKDLDKYYFHNWVAYILTQTIMFSPAYELSSTHAPNVEGVYNRLVNMLDDEVGMRFITYSHMMSEDNWRRFRSPEDNGREMLEIYTLDLDDSHVPIAGQALQNWKLDTDGNTLVVGLNANTQTLSLFGTTIVNGDDFYRELAKSSSFTYGVVNRLVSFFFTDYTASQMNSITNTIVSSKPETWQDILKQIIFSKEYLLSSSRAKSAEEVLFPLVKKMDYDIWSQTLTHWKSSLDKMNQASMKYKLGRLTRVPLDTLSFINYYQKIRAVLLNRTNPVYVNNDSDDYTHDDREGWRDSFLDKINSSLNVNHQEESLELLINYIFQLIISRGATVDEMAMFKSYMLEGSSLKDTFDMFNSSGNIITDKRNAIAFIVLEYISRLDNLYMQKGVN